MERLICGKDLILGLSEDKAFAFPLGHGTII